MFWFDSAYEAVARFMEMGGNVLWLIAILLFCMWALIFERVWYLQVGWKKDVGKAIATWEGRAERKSWNAHQVRQKLISEAKLQINMYLPVIKTMVALCPLLGLLGTVTGMINTFQAITLYGAGDPQIMAGGISQALVTTVLGLLVAIPLTLLYTLVSSRAKRIIHVLEEQAAGIVALHAEKN